MLQVHFELLNITEFVYLYSLIKKFFFIFKFCWIKNILFRLIFSIIVQT